MIARRIAPALAMTALLLATGQGRAADRRIDAPLLEMQRLPDSYADAAPAGTPDLTIARWWQGFDDPAITLLAERVIAANQDIVQAAARLAQARARGRAAGAARLPTLTTTLSASRDVARPAALIGSRNALGGEVALGWDPDLFGGLAAGHRGARAELAAAGYDLAAVQRAAVAEAVGTLLTCRGLEQRIANTRRALVTQREMLTVVEHRLRSGIATAVDVEQARLQLLQMEALVPQLENARDQSLNRIAVLVNEAPGHLGDWLAPAGPT